MQFNRFLLMLCTALVPCFMACSDDGVKEPDNVKEPPLPTIVPAGTNIKPKALWIDVHANFQRLATKAGIDAELKKIKNCGFNMIYLDVKAGNGYALYKSDILPYCNKFGNLSVSRDYDDYLGYFLERCDELNIDVVASVCAMGWGAQDKNVRQGYVFDNWDQWKNKVQMRSDSADPTKIVPITDDDGQAYAMLDPMYPEVQQLLVSVISELVTKYPGLKGVSLDYLRYANNNGGWFGMGDNNMKGFAEYWDEDVPDHLDIVTASGGQGPKFQQWLEYRASVVTGLLAKVRHAVKSINPDCEIHLWAGEWQGRYSVGQNWASKRYKPQSYLYTETYNRTGFADLLDVFILGAYCEKVWESENPGSIWSVEYLCKTWNDFIMGDCKCYGSIGIYALTNEQISDATYVCLKNTDGYMNFELSHINAGTNRWSATCDGIRRYEGWK